MEPNTITAASVTARGMRRNGRRAKRWAYLLLLLALLCLLPLVAGGLGDGGGEASVEVTEDGDVVTVTDGDDEDGELPAARGEPETVQEREEPVLVVATVDGHLHAVEVDGEARWSLDLGNGPLVSSYQNPESPRPDAPVLIPALDGSLLVHTPNGIQQSSLRTAQLVERAPFIAPDGTLYTGSRTSEALMIDLTTGRVLQRFRGPSADKVASMIDPRLSSRLPHLLWVGRVDLTLRAVDPVTGQELWNLTSSEVTPLFSPPPSLAFPTNNMLMGVGGGWSGTLIATPDGGLRRRDIPTPTSGSSGSSSSAAHAVRPLGSPAVTAFAVHPYGGGSGGLLHRPVAINYALTSAPPPSPSSGPSSPSSSGSDLDEDDEDPSALPPLHQQHVAISSLPDRPSHIFAMPLPPTAITSTIMGQQPTSLPHLLPSPQSALPSPTTATANRNPNMEINSNLPRRPTDRRWQQPTSSSSSSPSSLPDAPLSRRPTSTNPACRPGQPAYPSCLLGIHTVSSLKPRQPTSSTSQQQQQLSDTLHLLGPSQRSPTSTPPTSPTNWISHPRQSLRTWMRGRELLLLLTLALVALLAAALNYSVHTPTDSPRRLLPATKPVDEPPPATPAPQEVAAVEPAPQQQQGPLMVDGMLRVGRLVVTGDVLGYGCHGTIVYRGKLEDGRPVAVKRMLKAFHEAAEREMRLLIESDGHPNVVRYFLREECGDFVYLALELCVYSLRDVIGRMGHWSVSAMQQGRVPGPVRTVLKQMATGVAHLHGLRIVHRDIKPHNILLAQCSKTDKANKAAARSQAVGGGASEPDRSSSSSSSTPFAAPSVVVLDSLDSLSSLICKISDMGVGKLLPFGQSSFSSLHLKTPEQQAVRLQQQQQQMDVSSSGAQAPGSVGWQAPEILAARAHMEEAMHIDVHAASSSNSTSSRQTQAVDVFSLGCVFYTVLVPGQHPFGEWFERERNILKGKSRLDGLSAVPDAKDLVACMIRPDPSQRPTAEMVLRHPFFWDDEKRLAFLVDFSDRLEQEAPESLVVLAVESNGAEVVGRSWDSRLDRGLLEDVNKFRKYDTASVRDCLRIIRNKRHHFHDLPAEVQALMAPFPGGLYRYFETRFPRLLMHCYHICTRFLTQDKIFRIYIGESPPLPPPPSAPAPTITAEPSDSKPAEPERSTAAAVTEDNGALGGASPAVVGDEALLRHVTVYAGTGLASTYTCRGWWRPAEHWAKRMEAGKPKARPPHLTRAVADPKYRTRLCTHWEASAKGDDGSGNGLGPGGVPACPMRKKGKCDFAHGPVELRVKETRRARWGSSGSAAVGPAGEAEALRLSGGEDPLGLAREAEKLRVRTSSGGGGREGRGGGGPSRQPGGTAPSRSRGSSTGSGGGGAAESAGSWRRGASTASDTEASPRAAPPPTAQGGRPPPPTPPSFADAVKRS